MISKIKAELIISGGNDFVPDKFSIGLAADQICHIGDPVGRSIIKQKKNMWIISTGYSECLSLAKCVSALFLRLDPHWGRLQSKAARNFDVQLSVVVHMYDESPELNLDEEMLAKLASIGASLDIDTILLNDLNEPRREP